MSDRTDPSHAGLRVARVVRDPAGATSFALVVPDELAGRFAFRPGQFLTVAVPGTDGPVARCYSMSSRPGRDGHPGAEVTITVKRIEGGHASGWLCDHLCVGACCTCCHPPASSPRPRSTSTCCWSRVAAASRP